MICRALLVALFATLPPAAMAQGLPGSVDPGRIPRQFEPLPGPAPVPELIVPTIPELLAPAEAARITFALRRIIIEGATVYPEERLRPLYADLLGKTVSVADIYRLADAITTKYRSDGYVLSRAIVPAQRIADGEVRIVVIEGFVDRVIVDGDSDPAIRSYGERILRSKPLRAADLERSLLLINDLPGISARGVLAPATGVPGASELTLLVKRRFIDVLLHPDNRGTKFIGPNQILAEVALNNPGGRSDQVTLRYITAFPDEEELRYVEADYEIPIGSDGTRLSLSAIANESRPGSTLQSDFLRTETSGRTVTARITHPILRSRTQNLIVDGAFTLRNSSTDQTALPSETRLVTSYDDRIRVVRAGISYDTIDRWEARDFVRLELSQGIPIFNASEDGALVDASRPGGRTTFTKGTFDASRLQSLDRVLRGLNLLGAVSAGWSFGQQLLASEQFGVGGSQFGRGYDPSEITGDYGAVGKLELQYNFRPDLGDIMGPSVTPALQFYAFYDYGAVFDQDPQSLNEPARSRQLASTGVGLRGTWRGQFTWNIELDKPLTRGVAAKAGSSDPKAPRLYVSLIAKF